MVVRSRGNFGSRFDKTRPMFKISNFYENFVSLCDSFFFVEENVTTN